METEPVSILTLIRRPRRVNFAFGQLDFQFTGPNGQVENLDQSVVIEMNGGA